MNRILYYILLIILAGLASGFMFMSSFSFEDSANAIVNKTEENKWYKVKLSGPVEDTKISYTAIEGKQVISPGTVVLGEVGRLASITYIAQTGSVFPPLTRSGSQKKLSQSGVTQLYLADSEAIISLYDLFGTYSIHSLSGEYRIDQITNGSFYIGKEQDGRIAVYAIDGVIRLAFLSEGVEMTNMILFPGSFIRFDPTRNSELNGVDLFRTILSLQDKDNEVFEFIDPRANTGKDSDTFFNYRLPTETKQLFRAVSTRFHDQIESIDLIKSYGADSATIQASKDSTWMQNPSKKNYLMLQELKFLLSQVVRTNNQNVASTESTTLVSRISSIYSDTKSLNLESSSAKKMIEQFLLDGRFALYESSSDQGTGYQDMYQKIAMMIGVKQTEGKSKLFQGLSDIYSANFFIQSKKTSTVNINVFDPTSVVLRKTVDDKNIDPKDFFDIAIYAFSIMNKVQDKGILSLSTLNNKATYDMLTTFFLAGNIYMTSIDDITKRIQTIQSFSTKFYEPMLKMVVNSLYNALMHTDESGRIYFQDKYLNGNELKVSTDLMKYIGRLNSVIKILSPNIKSGLSKSGISTNVSKSIEKNTRRLQALSDLLDITQYNENYLTYIENPYIVESGSLLPLPALDENLTDFLHPSDAVIEDPIIIPPENTSSSGSDESALLAQVRGLFPDADTSTLLVDGQGVRAIKAGGFVSKTDGTTTSVKWSLYVSDMKHISQVFLQYGGRTIELRFSTQEIDDVALRSIISRGLAPYIDIIDNNSDLEGNAKIYFFSKEMQIGTQSFTIQ